MGTKNKKSDLIKKLKKRIEKRQKIVRQPGFLGGPNADVDYDPEVWQKLQQVVIRSRDRLAAMWSYEKIEAFTTEQILAKLAELGIEITPEGFRAQTSRFNSPVDLAEALWSKQADAAPGPDGDFPWMSAVILWRRLAPDVPNVVAIADTISRADDLAQEGDFVAASKEQLAVWEAFKQRFIAGRRSIMEIDELMSGEDYRIDKWLAIASDDMAKAAETEPQFHEVRLDFCREVAQLLPDSPADILANLGMDEVQTLVALNRRTDAEARYAELEAQHPGNNDIATRYAELFGPPASSPPE